MVISEVEKSIQQESTLLLQDFEFDQPNTTLNIAVADERFGDTDWTISVEIKPRNRSKSIKLTHIQVEFFDYHQSNSSNSSNFQSFSKAAILKGIGTDMSSILGIVTYEKLLKTVKNQSNTETYEEKLKESLSEFTFEAKRQNNFNNMLELMLLHSARILFETYKFKVTMWLLLFLFLFKGNVEAVRANHSDYIFSGHLIAAVGNTNLNRNQLPSMSSNTILLASDVNNNLTSNSEGEEDQENLHSRKSKTPPGSIELVYGTPHESWYSRYNTVAEWSRWDEKTNTDDTGSRSRLSNRNHHSQDEPEETTVKNPYAGHVEDVYTSGIGTGHSSFNLYNSSTAVYRHRSEYSSLEQDHLNDSQSNQRRMTITYRLENAEHGRSFEVMPGETMAQVIGDVNERAVHLLRDMQISENVPFGLILESLTSQSITDPNTATERNVDDLSKEENLQPVYENLCFVIQICGAVGGSA